MAAVHARCAGQGISGESAKPWLPGYHTSDLLHCEGTGCTKSAPEKPRSDKRSGTYCSHGRHARNEARLDSLLVHTKCQNQPLHAAALCVSLCLRVRTEVQSLICFWLCQASYSRTVHTHCELRWGPRGALTLSCDPHEQAEPDSHYGASVDVGRQAKPRRPVDLDLDFLVR